MAEESDRLEFEALVDKPMQSRIVRAALRYSLRRILLAFLPAAAVVAVVVAVKGDWLYAMVAFPLLLAMVLVVIPRTYRISVARVYAVGEVARTSYGSQEVRTTGAALEAVQPYAKLGEPVILDRVVLFPSLANRRQAWIVPVELCPPEALTVIVGANRAGVAVPATDPADFSRTSVADPRTADRLAASVFLAGQRTGSGILVAAMPLVAGVSLAVALSPWWLLVGLAVVPWFLFLLRSTRTMLRKQFPDGSVSAVRFTESGLVLHHRGGEVAWRYADFDRVWVGEHAVVLRDGVQKMCFYPFPRALFSDADLAVLRAAIPE